MEQSTSGTSGLPTPKSTSGFCAVDRLRELLSDLPGKRVLLIGLGLFGGGEGAARFLGQKGARLTITDPKTPEQLAPTIKRLSDLSLQYRLGPDYVGAQHAAAPQADLLVVNPAVPRTCELLRLYRQAGVPITSPMNMFLALCPAPVAGVTGSTGKSTTTAMLGQMLQRAGRPVLLGGNIGISLLPLVESITADHIVVLEMSCFQVEDAACLPWSPQVAVLTNITPNHLDRYESFGAYAAAKQNILAFQSESDAAVLNASDAILWRWGRQQLRSHVIFFEVESSRRPLARGMSLRHGKLIWTDGASQEIICSREDIPLPGAHNLANALAAAAAAHWLGVRAEAVRSALREFKPLEHRLEPCGVFGGATFYNDSNSTTPQSTVAALESFRRPVTLIAGGYDKGLDLDPLARAIAERVEVLITMGRCGPRIAQLTRQKRQLAPGADTSPEAPLIREADSLEEAVEAALQLSMPGSMVLFSPACASYDMFQNYAERGQRFKDLVAASAPGRPASRAKRA